VVAYDLTTLYIRNGADKEDNFLFLLSATSYILYVVHHAFRQMDINKIGRQATEVLTGQREELTRIDTNDYTNQQFDKLIVRNSISLSIVYLALGLIATVLLLIPRKDDMNLIDMFKSNWLWATVIAMIPIVIVYFGIRGLTDRTPKLIVDTDGIKTKDWSAAWSDIVETKFKFLSGKTTYLIIKTQTTEKSIDIGITNIGPRFLGHHIELLKKRAS
jgi:hypothetical protein